MIWNSKPVTSAHALVKAGLTVTALGFKPRCQCSNYWATISRQGGRVGICPTFRTYKSKLSHQHLNVVQYVLSDPNPTNLNTPKVIMIYFARLQWIGLATVIYCNKVHLQIGKYYLDHKWWVISGDNASVVEFCLLVTMLKACLEGLNTEGLKHDLTDL